MAGFKFVHTADLHLDSPFSGIGQVAPALQKRLLLSTFKTFHNIIDLCIKENVEFLLIAGDLYNEADLSLKAQLTCRDEFKRLNKVGIQVYVAHGNHDHCAGWRADLNWPDNVHFFPAGEVGRFHYIKDGQEIARIFGISYPIRDVRENYVPAFVQAARASEVTESKDGSPYFIGVLHTNVGSVAGYDNYAPCTARELVQAGYDYWALGHVHSHQIVHPAEPMVIYPGTPQGRSSLECGPKGCCLVQVSTAGETRCQWIEVDDLRWVDMCLSIEGLERTQDLLLALEQQIEVTVDGLAGRSGILNITLTGRGVLAREIGRPGFLPDLLEQLRAERDGLTPLVWIATLKNATKMDLPLEELRHEESLLGDFLKLTLRGQSLAEFPNLREVLLAETAPLYKDRVLRKVLAETDDALLERIVRLSEELGLELFGLEVE